MTGTAEATCQACDWTETGDPKATDRAADKHTRTTSHSTAVRVTR